MGKKTMKDNKEKNEMTVWQRYLDGLYTTQDVHRLQEELHDSASEGLLEELSAEVWEEAALHSCTETEHERYKEEARQLLRRMEGKKPVRYRRWLLTTASIAALIALLWAGGSYLMSLSRSSVAYLEASTTYGEHKEIHLPDGTELILNACSQVRYPERFTGKERHIKLEGEGFFRVSPDKEHPFLIHTSSFDIRVLGTSFNVKSYSSDETVSVNVESGKVQVELPEAFMRLKANEQILINTVSGEYAKQYEKRHIAVWREGNLCFDATPIHDVAKELERRYNCRITFAEHQDFTNLISGEHENKSLEDVLRSIEYTSGIHYKISGRDVMLYKE